MNINSEKLKELLDKGIVEISFISLNSGIVISREFTTCEKLMPVPKHIKSYSGDKIICYDVEFKKWEDIEVNTIESYKTLEKL